MNSRKVFLYCIVFFLLLCMTGVASEEAVVNATEHVGGGKTAGDWGTYFGGESIDSASAITLGSAGNVYIVGDTSAPGWTSGGYDTSFGGEVDGWLSDGYIVKLSPSGAHIWSSYLGGSSYESAHGVAVDADGNVYVVGSTDSPEAWVSGGYQEYGYGGFVVKLSPTGTHLWSTFIGAAHAVTDVKLDSAGNVCVSGYSSFQGDWTAGGYDTTYGGESEGFVAKLSPSGAHLWSTFVGGSGHDFAARLALDNSDNIVVTGFTTSSDWISGGYQTTPPGGKDAFIVKLSPAGAHIWSTYVGGAGDDEPLGLDVDSAGNIYITGESQTAGLTLNGSEMPFFDGYVAALSSNSTPLWMTYLSGLTWMTGKGIVSSGDNLYVTGGGGFILKLSNAGANLWATYLPPNNPTSLAVDTQGNVYVAGQTPESWPDWIANGWDTTANGGLDGFAVKFKETTGEGAEICIIGLEGSQVVPPVQTAATGIATFSAMPNAMIKLRIEHEVQNPAGAYICWGNSGETGSEWLNLGDATSPIDYFMSLHEYKGIPGNKYIVIKSADHPQGEIRGQIECGCAHVCPDLTGSGETLYSAPLLNSFVGAFEIPPLDWPGIDPLASTPDLDGAVQVVIGKWEQVGKVERWERWERWEKSGRSAKTLTSGDFNVYDSWEIGLFEEVLCSPFSHELKTAACDAYTYNLDLLPTDNPLLVNQMVELDALEFVAAAMAISSDWRETFYLMGLQNEYKSVAMAAKSGDYEPFSPGGDLDGDGVTNQEAFDATIGAGGNMNSFIQSATQNIVWDDVEPPTNVPVGTGTGLASLVGLVIAAGLAILCRMRKNPAKS